MISTVTVSTILNIIYYKASYQQLIKISVNFVIYLENNFYEPLELTMSF